VGWVDGCDRLGAGPLGAVPLGAVPLAGFPGTEPLPGEVAGLGMVSRIPA
jgi:hypothetical protein